MKSSVFLFFISLFNGIYIRLFTSVRSPKSVFTLTKIKTNKFNKTDISRSTLVNSKIFVSGKDNTVRIDHVNMKNTDIRIKGQGNNFIIDSNVILHNGTIALRGNNCTIRIKKESSFNGVRMVNVGKDNLIEIGENCLFADHIEVWASDTHAIYDAEGQFINPEKSIIIRDHVWVGSYTKILKGVTIGEGAVLGMNTFVVKDIPAKALAVGNPAKVIRENVTWSHDYPNEK